MKIFCVITQKRTLSVKKDHHRGVVQYTIHIFEPCPLLKVKYSSVAQNMLRDPIKLSGLLCLGCCPESGVTELLNIYESLFESLYVGYRMETIYLHVLNVQSITESVYITRLIPNLSQTNYVSLLTL